VGPTITREVKVEETIAINRDYCLEQAVLCLLGRGRVPDPAIIAPVHSGQQVRYDPSQMAPGQFPGDDRHFLPGPLEWAQAWRDLAAEFKAPRVK